MNIIDKIMEGVWYRMCPGYIVLMLLLFIKLLICIIVIVQFGGTIGYMKIIMGGIPVLICGFLFWYFWSHVLLGMCANNLSIESLFVFVTPLLYIIIGILTYYITIILWSMIDISRKRLIKDIILTSDLKKTLHGLIFENIDANTGNKILEKIKKIEDEALYYKELALKNKKDQNIKEEKYNREKSVELFKQAVIKQQEAYRMNHNYYLKDWMIYNIDDNPYIIELHGKERNKHKYGIIVFEEKITGGWIGALKILKIKKTVNIDLTNEEDKKNLLNTDNIESEQYIRVIFKTDNYDRDVMIFKFKNREEIIFTIKK